MPTGRRACPDGHVQTDDELLDYARRNGSTCYHASCTCMMGQHAMAVVDDELRVYGFDGLRVIDTSVMPAQASGACYEDSCHMQIGLSNVLPGARISHSQ
jgi:choline dehydrogenase-like flavoprotein